MTEHIFSNNEDILDLFWKSEAQEQLSFVAERINYLEEKIELDTNHQSLNSTTNSMINQNKKTNKNLISLDCITKKEGSKQKYFQIKKFLRYDEIFKKICKKKPKNQKRIKFIEDKTFKTMPDEEKVKNLKTLSVLVRRYRRRLINLKLKLKKQRIKSFDKLLNKSNKNEDKVKLKLENLVKCLRKLNNSREIHFFDERNLIGNFVESILNKKLKLNSINFKVICTQVRLFLKKSSIRQTNRNRSKISVNLPEKEVFISKKELDFYKNIRNEEEFSTIFGVGHPRKIKFSPKMNITENNTDIEEIGLKNNTFETLFNNNEKESTNEFFFDEIFNSY